MKIDFEETMKRAVDQAMKECELTIGMTLKDCVEKQVPKEPIFEADGCDDKGNLTYGTWHCPNCNVSYYAGDKKQGYCPNCGQRIDWR